MNMRCVQMHDGGTAIGSGQRTMGTRGERQHERIGIHDQSRYALCTHQKGCAANEDETKQLSLVGYNL